MNQVKLQVEIADTGLCPRYQAVVMKLPAENKHRYLTRMSTNLARSGMRSIDPVVDVTNELMLLTGQPLHAFDYDKLVSVGRTASLKSVVRGRGMSNTTPLRSSTSPNIASQQSTNSDDDAHIIVRGAKKGEKLELLDGKTITMDTADIVITSNDVPVALAGAMGGANTAIDSTTKRSVLESATFNLYNLRGTQFRHGIFSEAITRFTKGQPPALTDFVLHKFVEQTEKHFGLKAISNVVDTYPKPAKPVVVKITTEQVNNLLGTNYSTADITKTLEHVGFEMELNQTENQLKNPTIQVHVPYWRTDIHLPEDVIEEVGRLNGYDNIKPTLPTRDFTAVMPNQLYLLQQTIRQTLSASGANEVLTYSFVDSDLLKKVGQDTDNSYKIVNSISPKLQLIRQQIVPSLLEKAYENWRSNYDKFALFELNQVYQKSLGLTDENVPKTYNNLGFVIVQKSSKSNFYLAKKYLTELARRLHIEPVFDSVENLPRDENFFEPKRSAAVSLWTKDENSNDVKRPIGVIGELKNLVAENMKLPVGTAAFEIGLDAILGETGATTYRPQSRYPATKRDITLQVAATTPFGQVESLVGEVLYNFAADMDWRVRPVDIFAPSDSLKNITLHIEIADYQKTIDSQFVSGLIDKISKISADKLKAKII
jgi:phenylalanyl-tRNA synthetase beta chain